MSAERLPPAPLALRARLAEMEECWLEVRCSGCPRITVMPIKLLASRLGGQRQLGAILPRIVCKACGGRPAEIYLNETHNREWQGGGIPGWSLRLVPAADPYQ